MLLCIPQHLLCDFPVGSPAQQVNWPVGSAAMGNVKVVLNDIANESHPGIVRAPTLTFIRGIERPIFSDTMAVSVELKERRNE